MTHITGELTWIKNLMNELSIGEFTYNNLIFYERIKHIQIKYYFLKELSYDVGRCMY